jgi:hypothetical protein
VGALLPSTRAENRLLGETRDALGQQVQDAVQEGYERVRDAAGEKSKQLACSTRQSFR